MVGGTAGSAGASNVGGTAGASGSSGSAGSGTVSADPTASCPNGKAAFPGAQGPGACATGGRGGDVYHVTNLDGANDANPSPGSLRYGLNTVPAGGRTIVFDVAGTIRLSPAGRAGWLATQASNVTIAGQTAPQPGITIMGQATKLTGKNVIVRHVKFRPGQDQKSPGVATNDGLWITGQNIIVDHLSVSWTDDELLSVTDSAEKVTAQYCVLEDALAALLVAGNEAGKSHSMGGIIGSDVGNTTIAVHHSLYAHSATRNPRFGSETTPGSTNEWSNNVAYNWGKPCGYAGTDQAYRANMRGNYYIAGSDSAPEMMFNAAGVAGSIYWNGNFTDLNKNGKIDGAAAAAGMLTGKYTVASSPFNAAYPSPDTAEVALDKVLSTAGAFYWSRDRIDARVIDDVKKGTGAIPDLPNSTEWSELWNATTPVKRPAGFDTDGDGLPNAWESAHGLNPNDASDGNKVEGDYTNLENYLNQAATGASYYP